MSLAPPKHLSRPSKAVWRSTVEDYGLESEPHSVRVSGMAPEASDRAEEARVRIAQDGAYLLDRFGQTKTHPAVAVERDARIATARLFRELALDPDSGQPGEARPPRPTSGR